MYVVQILGACRFAKARRARRNHSVTNRQPFEQRRPLQAGDSVQEKQRVARPTFK